MIHSLPAPEQAHLTATIGEQVSPHLARRAVVRHSTPLLPRSWAELLAPWRKTASRGDHPAGNRPHDGQDGLASQTK